MATTTTSEPFNAYQFALANPGVPFTTYGPTGGVTTIATIGLSQGALDAAVAAHQANPEVQPPPDPLDTPPNPNAEMRCDENDVCWWTWLDDTGVWVSIRVYPEEG